MNFSLSTVINTTIVTSLMIGMITLFMSSRRFLQHIRFYSVLAACVLIVVRCLFPYEFPFTRNIDIPNLWGEVFQFFYHDYYWNDIWFQPVYFLLFGWMLGAFWFLQKQIRNYIHNLKAANVLPPADDPVIRSALEQVNVGYSNSVNVRTVRSSETAVPCIMGILHPVLILPDTELSEREWIYIIRHELSHYSRGHLHLQCLMELLTAIYFWNPLIRILKKQLIRLMELDADDMAVREMPAVEKVDYAKCLTKMARLHYEATGTYPHGIPFATLHSGLSQRVQVLLENSSCNRRPVIDLGFAGLICSLICVSYLFILEPKYDVYTNERGNPVFDLSGDNSYYRPNPDGSYDLISNGDYIITVTEIFDPNIPIKEE